MEVERYEALVTHRNRETGRFAARILDYGWIVADPEEPEDIGVGDQLRDVEREHGDQVLLNLTRGERVRVYVEAFDAGEGAVTALLGFD